MVVIAMLPGGAEPGDIPVEAGFAPGLVGAGLSTVLSAQTYLDITQGNRIFTSLYDTQPGFELPFGGRVPRWGEIAERAETAPARIVPGLLASALGAEKVPTRVDRVLVGAALIGADRTGRIRRADLDCARRRCPPGLNVVAATPADLPALAARLRGDDLLIALERPPAPRGKQLAAGIAGSGFDGNLVSDTTRTPGLVSATDIAPTVLERFGIEVPDEMLGRPIRSEGEPDPAAVESLADRLPVVSPRRGPVIFTGILIWLVLAAAAIAASRGRGAELALTLLALAIVYVPLLLLLGAALEPSRTVERLIVGLGAPMAAAVTLAATRRPYGALAVACALTVGAHVADVIAGSSLTQRSLAGPNPALGARFYGIGNELGAAFGVLVPVGVGAALTAWAPPPRGRSARRAALTFLLVGVGLAVPLAAGRIGAAVGTSIMLPLAGAVAAAVVLGWRGWRLAALVVLVPVGGVAALVALDLALGGGAHLTRSVLEAGGAGEVGDVIERRLTLTARSFERRLTSPYLVATAVGIALVVWRRRDVAGWLDGRRAALAGLSGAAVSIAVGALANDSGAAILLLGSGFLAACLGLVWAARPAAGGGRPRFGGPPSG